VARKIFAIIWQNFGSPNCGIGTEILLYDFSKNIQDTLSGCIGTTFPDFPFIIDTITTENIWGAQRTAYGTSVYGVEEKLIEGIGFSAGLFESANHVPTTLNWGSYLYDYCIGTDEYCDLISNIEKIKNESVIIYPNPTLSILNVTIKGTNNQNLIQTIRLTNNLGQEIFNETHIGAIQYQLKFEKTNSGVFFLIVEMQSGEKYLKRIVKH